ncbi:MAG: hypothetical protein H7839_05415 [Magnetococcus sp. YQC-5]
MKASGNKAVIQPSQLAPILRSDGTLRYDILCGGRLHEMLPADLLADPGILVLLELCHQGRLHSLVEVFGNIDVDQFVQTRRAIGEAIVDPRLVGSPLATVLKRALLKAVKIIHDREPKARAVEHLIGQPDVLEQLHREVLSLESRCASAGETRHHQQSCRQDFWRLWEMAWAVRIYIVDERVIEAMEKMYNRFSCLELREGDRMKLQLPGGMRDPRVQDERAVELW